MPRAVSAPLMKLLLPATKNAEFARNVFQKMSLIVLPDPAPSLRGTVVIAPRSSLMMSVRSIASIKA